jgi:hypothetical protein
MPQDGQDLLSTLRGLLYEPPSAESWGQLCRLFDAWTDDLALREIALDYAQQHLDAWPDKLREAPPAWSRAVLDEAPPPAWRLVRHVSLTSYGIGPNSVQRLAELPSMERVVQLNLANCNGKDDALCALAASPYVGQLRALDMGVNKITDRGLVALADSPLLGLLQTLDLTYNQITHVGAEALAKSPRARALRSLKLWHNNLGSQGALAVAESPYLTLLEELDLGSNNLEDAGARALLRALPARLPQLRDLNLSGNKLTEPLVRLFQTDPALQGRDLKLNLSGNTPALR